MKLPAALFIGVFYISVLTFVDLGCDATGLSKYSVDRREVLPPLVPPKLVEYGFDRREVLPPLVPPKLIDEDDEFEERDVEQRPNHLHLASSYWAPTLDNLSPGEAEFYRKALVNTNIGRNARSMGMLRMGRAADGVRRSMTMLRMGRAFDEDVDGEEEEEEEEKKRSMGMLRMGRGYGDDFRKSMSMLRMGRGISGEEEEEAKRSMGMLRMGRASANKNVDRGALNMLRMGKREANEGMGEEGEEEEAKAERTEKS